MHNRAACNGVAIQTLKIVYPQLVDVGCFSHTINLVGEKFSIPHLSSFTIWWVSLFSFLTAHGQNCCGKRELAEHLKAIQPQDGGASMKLCDNSWNSLLMFNLYWKPILKFNQPQGESSFLCCRMMRKRNTSLWS